MKPTDEQKREAMLHATAWEHAADNLRQHVSGDPVATERRLETTIAQLNAVKCLAYGVAAGYRRLVNGAEIDE